MENRNLYASVKRRIRRQIFDGVYRDGEAIPPERTLAETLGVSRVTLRRALQLLEEDGIVKRVQGSGTRVKFNLEGHAGTLDIIKLAAPAQNPFFSSFIDAFQQTAEAHDSLVLFKQKPAGETLEESLFRLCQKDLNNVVLWPDDQKISGESLKKLRGLGMNLVLFDVRLSTPYADCVFLDNRDAIQKLCAALRSKGCGALGYIGWDNRDISSVRERESVFHETEPSGRILLSVPWNEKERLAAIAAEFAADFSPSDADGIVFGDGEIGSAFARAFSLSARPPRLGTVDEFPGSAELGLTTCAQDFEGISRQAYLCLRQQNFQAKSWRASSYPIPGRLNVR